MAARRKHKGKQPPSLAYLLGETAAKAYYQALGDEAWTEVTALSDDARRKHVHWVHVRTHNDQHRQPSSFSREEFWAHMVRVYKEVYPDASSAETQSILLFGLVAKERHAASEKEQEREEHHHVPVYTSQAHYWKPVARRSLELGVKLHVARHDGYTAMYVYVMCPTPKWRRRNLPIGVPCRRARLATRGAKATAR